MDTEQDARVEKPEGDWLRQFGSFDHVHAIGAAILAFNNLENAAKAVWVVLGELRDDDVWHKSSNWKRMKDMTDAVETRTPSGDPEAMHARHFAEGFLICADNRNVLGHSSVSDPTGPLAVLLGLVKSDRKAPYQPLLYPVAVLDLHRTVRAMVTWNDYGIRLGWAKFNQVERGETASFEAIERPILPATIDPVVIPR